MFEKDTEAEVDVIWDEVPLLTSLRVSVIKQLEKTFVCTWKLFSLHLMIFYFVLYL